MASSRLKGDMNWSQKKRQLGLYDNRYCLLFETKYLICLLNGIFKRILIKSDFYRTAIILNLKWMSILIRYWYIYLVRDGFLPSLFFVTSCHFACHFLSLLVTSCHLSSFFCHFLSLLVTCVTWHIHDILYFCNFVSQLRENGALWLIGTMCGKNEEFSF